MKFKKNLKRNKLTNLETYEENVELKNFFKF